MLGPAGWPAADLREDLGGLPPCPGRVVQPAGEAMAASLGLVVVAQWVGWSGPCRFGGDSPRRRAGRSRRPERAGRVGRWPLISGSARGVILDATGRGSPGGAGGRVDHASVRTEARPLPWGAEGIREEGRGVGQHVAARTIERTHARSE